MKPTLATLALAALAVVTQVTLAALENAATNARAARMHAVADWMEGNGPLTVVTVDRVPPVTRAAIREHARRTGQPLAESYAR